MSEGKKEDSGKLRYDLISAYGLEKLAEVYTIGANKYADRNWEKGIAWNRIFAAMMRHAWRWWNGEECDPVDGQKHLASVAWCAFALLEYGETHRELDNRPRPTKKATDVPVADKKDWNFKFTPYASPTWDATGPLPIKTGPISGGKIANYDGADAPCGHYKCRYSCQNPLGECLIDQENARQKAWYGVCKSVPCPPSESDGTGFSS